MDEGSRGLLRLEYGGDWQAIRKAFQDGGTAGKTNEFASLQRGCQQAFVQIVMVYGAEEEMFGFPTRGTKLADRLSYILGGFSGW
jgi:hypothetical protein